MLPLLAVHGELDAVDPSGAGGEERERGKGCVEEERFEAGGGVGGEVRGEYDSWCEGGGMEGGKVRVVEEGEVEDRVLPGEDGAEGAK